jgi:hypothetical protein
VAINSVHINDGENQDIYIVKYHGEEYFANKELGTKFNWFRFRKEKQYNLYMKYEYSVASYNHLVVWEHEIEIISEVYHTKIKDNYWSYPMWWRNRCCNKE